jgi:hypothetical protein
MNVLWVPGPVLSATAGASETARLMLAREERAVCVGADCALALKPTNQVDPGFCPLLTY